MSTYACPACIVMCGEIKSHFATLSHPFQVSWRPGEETEVAEVALDLFYRLPSLAVSFLESKGDRPGLVVLVMEVGGSPSLGLVQTLDLVRYVFKSLVTWSKIFVLSIVTYSSSAIPHHPHPSFLTILHPMTHTHTHAHTRIHSWRRSSLRCVPSTALAPPSRAPWGHPSGGRSPASSSSTRRNPRRTSWIHRCV